MTPVDPPFKPDAYYACLSIVSESMASLCGLLIAVGLYRLSVLKQRCTTLAEKLLPDASASEPQHRAHYLSFIANERFTELATFLKVQGLPDTVESLAVKTLATRIRSLEGWLYAVGGATILLVVICGVLSAMGPAIFAKGVGSSRVDLQACKLEYSIVSPK